MSMRFKLRAAAWLLAGVFAGIGCSDKFNNPSAQEGDLSAVRTTGGFEVLGDKVQIDPETLSAQGLPLIEEPQAQLVGRTKLLPRKRLQRGARLAALIDNECVQNRSRRGLADDIVRDAGDRPKLEVQAYAFQMSADTPLDELSAHADQDDCVLQVGNDIDVEAIAVPNDPSFSQQWFHTALQSSTAWDSFYSSTGIQSDVVVAVVDTGVDYNHADLKANMWKNANGDFGFDFYNDDNNPMDDNGHGTHCAGLVGAVGDNSAGGAGVMPSRVKIMAVKALSGRGSGSSTTIINAINYAVNNGANVISLSLGGRGSSSIWRTALLNAANKGVTVLAAAGNDSTRLSATNFYSPAGYAKDIPGVIAVGSIDRSLNRSSFSNYSPEYVEIGSPGSSIYSTLRNNSYGNLSGTSMATPIVAGAAGLVIGFLKGRGVNPSAALVEELILAGSVKDAGLTTTFKDGNRLHSKALVDLLINRYAPGTPIPEPPPMPAPAPAPAPAPSPTPVPDTAMSIVSVTLINARTNSPIRTLIDNAVIDASKDGSVFNMRAQVSGAVQSVRYEFKGLSFVRTDNLDPYTLVPEGRGITFSGNKVYEMVITPFSEDNAQGMMGKPLIIRFTTSGFSQPVPAPSPSPAPPSPSPSPTPSPTPGCGQMNADACAVFNGINLERTTRGLPALQVLSNCVDLAQAHAVDMQVNGFFSHTSPTKGSFSARAAAFGLRGSAGENIAYGQNNTTVVTAWMGSSGHRANILNSGYRSSGVGVQKDSRGRPYFVQCFSSMAGN